jgi:hypothetical protein
MEDAKYPHRKCNYPSLTVHKEKERQYMPILSGGNPPPTQTSFYSHIQRPKEVLSEGAVDAAVRSVAGEDFDGDETLSMSVIRWLAVLF